MSRYYHSRYVYYQSSASSVLNEDGNNGRAVITIVCTSNFILMPGATKPSCVLGQGSVGNLCTWYWVYIGPRRQKRYKIFSRRSVTPLALACLEGVRAWFSPSMCLSTSHSLLQWRSWLCSTFRRIWTHYIRREVNASARRVLFTT